ncbi:hypothetical protein HDK64DRAFT_125038 [Phyllosticta capitalensis]
MFVPDRPAGQLAEPPHSIEGLSSISLECFSSQRASKQASTAYRRISVDHFRFSAPPSAVCRRERKDSFLTITRLSRRPFCFPGSTRRDRRHETLARRQQSPEYSSTSTFPLFSVSYFSLSLSLRAYPHRLHHHSYPHTQRAFVVSLSFGIAQGTLRSITEHGHGAGVLSFKGGFFFSPSVFCQNFPLLHPPHRYHYNRVPWSWLSRTSLSVFSWLGSALVRLGWVGLGRVAGVHRSDLGLSWTCF